MKGKTGRGRRLPAQIERAEAIAGRIHVLRGERVMLDEDLAVLYGVPTKRLNEAVGRNLRRFPPDFMFRLTKDEATALKSQFATSNEGRGGRRRSTPRAFTEEGVAMPTTSFSPRFLRHSVPLNSLHLDQRARSASVRPRPPPARQRAVACRGTERYRSISRRRRLVDSPLTLVATPGRIQRKE